MAFIKFKERNTKGHQAEVITRQQAIALKKAQADYDNQTPEVQAKLDNIQAIYIPSNDPNQKKAEYTTLTNPGVLQGMSEIMPRGDR